MSERCDDIACWAGTVLKPAWQEVLALSVMLGVWWWGQQKLLVPHWEQVTSQITTARLKRHHRQQVAEAAQRLPMKGHLIAINIEALQQVCRDEAIRMGANLAALEWHADTGTLTVSLHGDKRLLLAWWDDIGRMAGLGAVQQWQLQPLISRDKMTETSAFQLEVMLRPDLWRWEACSSS